MGIRSDDRSSRTISQMAAVGVFLGHRLGRLAARSQWKALPECSNATVCISHLINRNSLLLSTANRVCARRHSAVARRSRLEGARLRRRILWIGARIRSGRIWLCTVSRIAWGRRTDNNRVLFLSIATAPLLEKYREEAQQTAKSGKNTEKYACRHAPHHRDENENHYHDDDNCCGPPREVVPSCYV